MNKKLSIKDHILVVGGEEIDIKKLSEKESPTIEAFIDSVETRLNKAPKIVCSKKDFLLSKVRLLFEIDEVEMIRINIPENKIAFECRKPSMLSSHISFDLKFD